jgi:hypothetical protein
VTGVGQDAEVPAPPGFAPLPVTPSTIGRKVVASPATLAVTGGLVGLATFGKFDDANDTFTRSTIAHPE